MEVLKLFFFEADRNWLFVSRKWIQGIEENFRMGDKHHPGTQAAPEARPPQAKSIPISSGAGTGRCLLGLASTERFQIL